MKTLLNKALDATVVLSFGGGGYRRHARDFRPDDLDVDLTGRSCLITGANSGIGFEASLSLARLGADVWMLCRDPDRGRVARDTVAAASSQDRVHLLIADVSSRASLDAAVASLPDSPSFRVDVLVHNAGTLPGERILSDDGAELTFATHVLGPFHLTRALAPRLGPGSRVLFVTSGGMYLRRLSLEDLSWQERPYDGVVAYAQTKRMQVVLTELLAERLKPRGVVAHAMHPGWADTAGVRSSLPRFWRLTRGMLRTPAEGADTLVWLAAADQALESTGALWFDRTVVDSHLLPGTRESAEDRAALWALCVGMSDGGTLEAPW